jgi:uncharacterized membrane protein
MAAFSPGEPRSPRVRSALEAMRVIAAGVLLILIAQQVLVDGSVERLVFLITALCVLLGIDALSKLPRRSEP